MLADVKIIYIVLHNAVYNIIQLELADDLSTSGRSARGRQRHSAAHLKTSRQGAARIRTSAAGYRSSQTLSAAHLKTSAAECRSPQNHSGRVPLI